MAKNTTKINTAKAILAMANKANTEYLEEKKVKALAAEAKKTAKMWKAEEARVIEAANNKLVAKAMNHKLTANGSVTAMVELAVDMPVSSIERVSEKLGKKGYQTRLYDGSHSKPPVTCIPPRLLVIAPAPKNEE